MNSTALAPGNRNLDLGLAILRIVAGVVFLAHGAQKLFVFGLAGVTGGFQGMGVPMPSVTAPLVSAVEFLGGIALILGLLTRLAAVGLAINMLGAILLVHLAAGFFLPNGYEFALTLCAASVALALTGPGAFSLDAAIGRRRARR
ncbi:MAG TPA: DoxX family protein [Longimicrobiaceae bacterium]|nr:DoxX family protein [Longimicrobiaceae bacterium]